ETVARKPPAWSERPVALNLAGERIAVQPHDTSVGKLRRVATVRSSPFDARKAHVVEGGLVRAGGRGSHRRAVLRLIGRWRGRRQTRAQRRHRKCQHQQHATPARREVNTCSHDLPSCPVLSKEKVSAKPRTRVSEQHGCNRLAWNG